MLLLTPYRSMMMLRLTCLTFAAAAYASTGCQRVPPASAVQPAAVQPPPQAVDTVSEANARTAQSVLLRIAGREEMPADSVFKNVKILNRVSARTFLTIMNIGYAR